MRFDIRTLARTISALVIAALMLLGTLSPALAQGRSGKNKHDRGRHYGWERGRHRGWDNSARRGRMWRDDDNQRRFRRRAFLRQRRDERRTISRYQRRNRVALFGTPARNWRTNRRAVYRRDRRF